MSLVQEQVAFLRDVRRFLDHAEQQGLLASGGELARTPSPVSPAAVQRIGPLDDLHLRRCAIELTFYASKDDDLLPVLDAARLRPLGAHWESLDPRNRWGGERFPLSTQFARDLGGWPGRATGSLMPLPPTAAVPMPSAGDARPPVVVADTGTSSLATPPVLKAGVSAPAAITRLQDLLKKTGAAITSNGIFDAPTATAVAAFQRGAGLVADGVVGDKTWSALTAATAEAQQQQASRWLGDADLDAAAKTLNLELPALKAVYQVESAGKGFIGDKPKILFEGHVFWRILAARGLDPVTLAAGNGDILYPAWTRQFYVGGAGEWTRLERAEKIDHAAARESASYGLFQILGEHWKTLGYASVDDYVDRMCRHERDQLDAFCRFVTRTKSQGVALVELLRARNWGDFARAYNGPKYRENAYDDKLRAAYRRNTLPPV